MTKKYRVCCFMDGFKFKEVEIERENEKSVWINGVRNAKSSNMYKYFETSEQAKNWVISNLSNQVANKEKDLCRYKDMLEKAKFFELED